MCVCVCVCVCVCGVVCVRVHVHVCVCVCVQTYARVFTYIFTALWYVRCWLRMQFLAIKHYLEISVITDKMLSKIQCNAGYCSSYHVV